MTTFWAGLSLGSVYAILAITYALTLNASGIFNFAQAQLVTVGVFAAYEAQTSLQWPIWWTSLLAAILAGGVALIEEQTVVRMIRSSGAQSDVALVATLGVAVAIDGIAFVVWGPNSYSVNFPGSPLPLHLLGGNLARSDLALIISCIVVTALLQFGMTHTRWGLAMRATAHDRDAAALRGVNVRLVSTGAFVLGGLIVGALAVPIGAKMYATYNLGDSLVVFAFVALALGGFGSYVASTAGGLVVGLGQEYTARYLNGNYSNLIVFALLLLILFVRPSGFMASTRQRVV
jgi:branched-chain amino acid transport system permease protein